MAKLWDRNAALVLIPAIQPLGYNPSDYNINLASIRRQRIKSRKKLKGLKQEFKADVPLTIHWDEKLLEDIYGKETVDRLPILVFIEGVYQLLGVPKLPSGTREATGAAVHNSSLQWGICDKIKCIRFDTTASNTGPRNGACILNKRWRKIYCGFFVDITYLRFY